MENIVVEKSNVLFRDIKLLCDHVSKDKKVLDIKPHLRYVYYFPIQKALFACNSYAGVFLDNYDIPYDKVLTFEIAKNTQSRVELALLKEHPTMQKKELEGLQQGACRFRKPLRRHIVVEGESRETLARLIHLHGYYNPLLVAELYTFVEGKEFTFIMPKKVVAPIRVVIGDVYFMVMPIKKQVDRLNISYKIEKWKK